MPRRAQGNGSSERTDELGDPCPVVPVERVPSVQFYEAFFEHHGPDGFPVVAPQRRPTFDEKGRADHGGDYDKHRDLQGRDEPGQVPGQAGPERFGDRRRVSGLEGRDVVLHVLVVPVRVVAADTLPVGLPVGLRALRLPPRPQRRAVRCPGRPCQAAPPARRQPRAWGSARPLRAPRSHRGCGQPARSAAEGSAPTAPSASALMIAGSSLGRGPSPWPGRSTAVTSQPAAARAGPSRHHVLADEVTPWRRPIDPSGGPWGAQDMTPRAGRAGPPGWLLTRRHRTLRTFGATAIRLGPGRGGGSSFWTSVGTWTSTGSPGPHPGGMASWPGITNASCRP